MKQMVLRIFTVLMLSIFVSSCLIPAKKERYLANFERFIKNIEKNSGNFKPKDWRWADKRYNLYGTEWYQKFSEELTLKEQLKVAEFKIRYQAVKEGSDIKRLFDEKLVKDLERMGEDVGKYIDENLDRDLEKLSKGAREIGDSAIKVVEDLLKEIKKKRE
jgi:hypothetical protein